MPRRDRASCPRCFYLLAIVLATGCAPAERTCPPLDSAGAGVDRAAHRERSSEPSPDAQSAILIVVDALRADAVLPSFSALHTDASSFDARSPSNQCLPAIASMLSSLDPERHHADHFGVLPRSVWTLPEVLRCEGFATASFAANGFAADRFGVDQGFERYRNYVRDGVQASADAVLFDAASWIAAHREERFFVYVHLIDVLTFDAPRAFAPRPEPRMPDASRMLPWLEEMREVDERLRAAEPHLGLGVVGDRGVAAGLVQRELRRGRPAAAQLRECG